MSTHIKVVKLACDKTDCKYNDGEYGCLAEQGYIFIGDDSKVQCFSYEPKEKNNG